jgi:hypothetical protein
VLGLGDPSRHPRVPRPGLHRLGRGLRPHRPGHLGRRAADLRAGRRPARDRLRHGPHGRGLRGGGRHADPDRGLPRRSRRRARGPPGRPSLPLPPRAADHPRGRHRAAVADRRDGGVHPGGRSAPRAEDRHVRPCRGRQPASDRRPRSCGLRLGQACARGVRGDLHEGDRHGRDDHRGARGRDGQAQVHGGAARPEHMALLRRIKAAFDPNGILNPGKLGS